MDLNLIWNGVDHLVSRLASPRLFFSGGLGDVDYLKSLPLSMEAEAARVRIESEEKLGGIIRRRASFPSPAPWLPEESSLAFMEMVIPDSPVHRLSPETPVFIHFAATGDETTLPRRLLVAEPLARKGIASIILENPYYGKRRPSHQKDFVITTLSDQFKMNQATILEGVSLLKWLDSLGYSNLGLTGVSMGGSMAASVAASTSLPVSVAACIAPVGPGPAFCYGALSHRVDWQRLIPELNEYSEERKTGEKQVDTDAAKGHPLPLAKRRLHRIMSVADLRNFSPPADPSRAILVGAHQDAYVPYRSVLALHEHWKGSRLRTVTGGHVSSVILKGNIFRDCIEDLAFNRSWS
ncbi:MAG: alpha/beta hydrolase family protein [Leptospiraceae bacterium]|nr:alpha/beta hydrolase family protein [Leptospiraceae bacterium]